MKVSAQPRKDSPNPVALLGALTLEFIEYAGKYAMFAYVAMQKSVSPPWRWRLILAQCVSIGVRSLPIALLTSIFVGMVMVIQTGVQLVKFGSKNYVPGISFMANAREMVPVFVGIVVGARVAASITAELGTMKVTEQIDAMDLLNVDPMRYLVAPRVIAMTIMLPLVSAICLVGGFLGGLVVADAALNIDYFAYYHTTLQFAYLEDIFGGLTKTIFFGTIIAMTGCFYGFNTEGGAAGVGRATTSSVVVTLVLILISDYILTTVLLWITGMK